MSVVVTGTGVVLPEADDDFAREVPARHRRRMDRISRITTAAVARALAAARLDPARDGDGIGVIADTSLGSAATVVAVLDGALADEPSISPLLFPNVVANAATGQAALALALRGPSSTLGGLGALPYADDLLRSGRARTLLVGGYDEPSALHREAFGEVGLDSIVPAYAEGAAFVVLERAGAARERGAPILATLEAASVATDPGHRLDGARAFGAGGWDAAVGEVLPDGRGVGLLVAAGWPGTALHEREEGWAHAHGTGTVRPKDARGEGFAGTAALAAVAAVRALDPRERGRADGAGGAVGVLAVGHDPTRGQTMAALFGGTERGEEP